MLFVKGLEGKPQLVQRSSSSSSEFPNKNYEIQQVSQQVSASQAQTERPALIAEFPLARLGQKNYYKYCIPSDSPLLKTSTQTTTSSDTTNCKLDWFGSNSTHEKTKKEEISFLLETMVKFIETQHVANVLMFYDKNTNFLNNGTTGGGSSQVFSSIQQACKVKNKNSKELITELFFAPKECLLSPSSARVTLELLSFPSLTQTNQTPEIQVTKEQLTRARISGFLRYGVFEYSAQPKKIPSSQNGGTKPHKTANLKVNWPLSFYLWKENETYCFLDPIWRQVKARELKFEELKNRCV
ncbi:hypothetical protein DNK47_01510 [Mycoplasma wenyonii]|uniref:Uncharacterized protein n=1 Tax=Mycoplasma wenyonii TaxID=65123 RepID=A0A328PVD4_9MOLU|nr:hypothetical protein [Mycoplasma wenyonii]RAO95069.1 hypothetical protein DNK47_01510 [Mycoplasma wenyonii]